MGGRGFSIDLITPCCNPVLAQHDTDVQIGIILWCLWSGVYVYAQDLEAFEMSWFEPHLQPNSLSPILLPCHCHFQGSPMKCLKRKRLSGDGIAPSAANVAQPTHSNICQRKGLQSQGSRGSRGSGGSRGGGKSPTDQSLQLISHTCFVPNFFGHFSDTLNLQVGPSAAGHCSMAHAC